MSYCYQCGKEFNGNKHVEFCSKKCRNTYKIPIKKQVHCVVCGKQYTQKLNVFCGKRCENKFKKGEF